jgi:hypothetical protein
MRVFLIALLFIHGALHLLGFFKAFQLAKIEQLTGSISKTTGIFWGLTALLFLATLITFLLKKDVWPIFALTAIVCSQLLIIFHWQDAKFGTIANILLLLFLLPIYGKQQFQKQLVTEKTAFIHALNTIEQETLKPEDINHLPPVVQQWLNQTGVMGKPKAFSARVKQTGQLKTKQESTWMPFEAEQYVDLNRPAFIWSTEVKAFAGMTLVGRDRLENGNGEMLIKLASLIPVVDQKNNLQMNTGALVRYLGEVCWFPSAAMNEFISWESLDEHSAKATMTWNNQTVSGVFRFSAQGEISSFEAERYFGGEQDAQLFLWKIETVSHKEFEGVKIPEKSRVIWKLPEGDFEWLHLTITDVNYNSTELY